MYLLRQTRTARRIRTIGNNVIKALSNINNSEEVSKSAVENTALNSAGVQPVNEYAQNGYSTQSVNNYAQKKLQFTA